MQVACDVTRHRRPPAPQLTIRKDMAQIEQIPGVSRTHHMLEGSSSSWKNTPEERAKAARAVAGLSDDATDCYRLLDILGLTAEEGKINEYEVS